MADASDTPAQSSGYDKVISALQAFEKDTYEQLNVRDLDDERRPALMDQYRSIFEALSQAKSPVTKITNNTTGVAVQLAVSTEKPIRGSNNANGRYAVQVGGHMGDSAINELVRSALSQGLGAQEGAVGSEGPNRNSADQPDNAQQESFVDVRDDDVSRTGTSAHPLEQFHIDSRDAPDGALQLDVRTETGRVRGYIPQGGVALRNHHPNTGQQISRGPFHVNSTADCFQVAGELTPEELRAVKNGFRSYGRYGPGRQLGGT